MPVTLVAGERDPFIISEGPAKGMRGYFARNSAGRLEGMHFGGRLASRADAGLTVARRGTSDAVGRRRAWTPAARRFRRELEARFDEVLVGRTAWRDLPPGSLLDPPRRTQSERRGGPAALAVLSADGRASGLVDPTGRRRGAERP